MNWYDDYGGLHLHPMPKAEQSENAPMYSGIEIVLKYRDGSLTENDCIRFLRFCEYLYKLDENTGKYRYFTTPISTNPRFSHDNYTGMACGIINVRRFYQKLHQQRDDRETLFYIDLANKLLKQIPFWHRHPRDLVFLNFLKIPFLFWPFLWVPSIAMIISCYQTYKVRNGNRIIKTDGKILALARLLTVKMPITYFICNRLISYLPRELPKPELDTVDPELKGFNRWVWCSWFLIFVYYFKNKHHPLRYLMAKLEASNKL